MIPVKGARRGWFDAESTTSINTNEIAVSPRTPPRHRTLPGGGDVVHGRIGDPVTAVRTAATDAEDAADELRADIACGVVSGDLAETQERQRHGRIDVRAGSPAPGRIHDCHRGEPHGRAHRACGASRVWEQDREPATQDARGSRSWSPPTS